jgi:hypothetical protein
MDQSPEGTVSSNNASRRTFLKGVGLATAAGLAAPILASTSADAATVPVILGINAPGPWQDFNDAMRIVPGPVGCRSYRDVPFSTAADCPTVFPGEPGSRVVASIRPHPDKILGDHPDFEAAIKRLIANGRDNPDLVAPALTVWHEAGNLYTDPNGKAPEAPGGPPTGHWGDYNLTPSRVRSMHVKMQQWCNDVGGVDYGCIIYGEIAKMASDKIQDDNWVPNAGFALDWYGIDVYRNADPGWGRGDLVNYTAVKNYMDRWLKVAQDRSGRASPTIYVCECNANDDANRPQFFNDLAAWLHVNTGRRMLTFFKEEPAPHGGPWSSASLTTIDALRDIKRTYGP